MGAGRPTAGPRGELLGWEIHGRPRRLARGLAGPPLAPKDWLGDL